MSNSRQQGIIAWFASNSVAANLLMLSIVILGLLSIKDLRKESFPQRPADTITVSVSFDSGDAIVTEEGIALKIEEALAKVNGIKRITSVSSANNANVSIEVQSDYDLDTLLREVKNKVDAIHNFPSSAEKPVIEKQLRSRHAYGIKIYGEAQQETLQTLAEQIKLELLSKDAISDVSIKGKAERMLAINIDEARLEAYGLSLSDVESAVNAESSSAMATSIRSPAEQINIKVAKQAYSAQAFGQIPIVTSNTGGMVRLADIATITDGFDDRSLVLARYDGQKGIGIEVAVSETGDVLKIVEQANAVVAKWQNTGALPANLKLESWYDGSEMIRDRLALLLKNALSGIALVFVVLALFLNLRVAIWVTAGLPFIFCGTLFFMGEQFTGMSINEMTTFGFILALGIVVDDAVVVGESIYATRRVDGDLLSSTIKGTQLVAVPTIFGVLTTIAVFVALSQIEGGMGHVYSQFAVIVAICLMLSVVESKLILPAHLAHLNTHRTIGHGWRDSWARIQHRCNQSLNWLNHRIYAPTLRWVLEYRYAASLIALAIFIVVISMPFNGSVRIGFFPSIPGSVISASLSMQNDASYGLTKQNLAILEAAAIEADRELRRGKQSEIGTLELIASDDLNGSVTIELVDNGSYSIDSFTQTWKKLVGNLEGSKALDIRSGFGGGNEFKVELKAWNPESLELAGERFREVLAGIDGVQGIDDNFHNGQQQLKFTLTEQGYALGMSTASLSQQLLQALGGSVVQSYQRNTDEVKVRVRYPEQARKSRENIAQAKVRLSNGSVVPLVVVAKIDTDYQQSERTRIGGLQAYYVSASVDKSRISSSELTQTLQAELVPELMQRFPDLSIHFAGEAEQQQETTHSMTELFIIAMLAIYILLAVPLRSYWQPVIIMMAIPFGLVGAILGHWMNDMMLSILSFNGIVALSGVVVNDSLLLVSRYNQNCAQGMPIRDAILESCTSRLRPVLLTSITTFAGLAPLLSETSAQAQFIIPAAASLGYGILFSTLITLVLVPALLMIQDDLVHWFGSAKRGSNTTVPRIRAVNKPMLDE